MIKLKEIVKDILQELDLTPEDLKKFNQIMQGGIKIPGSIHSKDADEGEVDYQKVGFGYGGPSWVGYKDIAPDRPYRSDYGSVGHSMVSLHDTSARDNS